MFEKWKEKRELKKQQEEAARRAREAAEIAVCNEFAKTIVDNYYQKLLYRSSYAKSEWGSDEVYIEFKRYSYDPSSELLVRLGPYISEDGKHGYHLYHHDASMRSIMLAVEKELSKRNPQLFAYTKGPAKERKERLIIESDDDVWYEEDGRVIIKGI